MAEQLLRLLTADCRQEAPVSRHITRSAGLPAVPSGGFRTKMRAAPARFADPAFAVLSSGKAPGGILPAAGLPGGLAGTFAAVQPVSVLTGFASAYLPWSLRPYPARFFTASPRPAGHPQPVSTAPEAAFTAAAVFRVFRTEVWP